MKTETIQTQVLGVAGTAARLQVKVPNGLSVARSVNWEVYACGDLNPVRYGLCLLDARSGTARVNVIGLQPKTTYQFRFVCGDECSLVGRFETAAQLAGGQRAA